MIIHVKTTPKSSQNKIEKISETKYKAWVTDAPEKGKANDKLIKLMAKHFTVAKSQIKIISGLNSRNKIVEIYL